MNSQPPIYSALHFFLFWAKNWWQLKLGWCKKEDQLREILFCVWIWLTDRDRRWYTFFCFFFCFVFLSFVFFKSCCQLVFLFFLSLTVTKFMHYFNKGCFRGTLIQWWKCFLIFFVLISILLLSIRIILSPPAAFISCSGQIGCMAPNTQAAKYNSLTTIQNCILHGCE